MKAIICAAGQGKRLRPLTEDKPKCLVKLNGLTIIEHHLNKLVENGIQEVIIVIGYKGNLIQEKIGNQYKGARIKYFSNEIYDRTDNMYSLWTAREEINDDIIFTNADTIVHSFLIKQLLNSEHENCFLADEGDAMFEGDAMRVTLREGKLTDIKKNIPDQDTHCLAIGFYKFSAQGAKKYYEEVQRLVENNEEGASFVQPLRNMAQFCPIKPVSTQDFKWVEIDNHEDLKQAEQVIAQIN